VPADPERAKVYGVESTLRELIAQANAVPGGPVAVVVGASKVVLPLEVRFGDVASVQRYCDKVMALEQLKAHWPVRPVSVRKRRGLKKAHWETSDVIAIPDADWAMRETVVLHELAHHLTPRALNHGPAFQGALLELYCEAMAPEVAFVARCLLYS
jgi:putative metallohydrolase (TIGR04338 family)